MANVIRDFKPQRGGRGWMFHCPGCECDHYFDERWKWNGSYDKPTFEPSLLIQDSSGTCHSYVRDGNIQYLSDCTHALAETTVPLPTDEEWLA